MVAMVLVVVVVDYGICDWLRIFCTDAVDRSSGRMLLCLWYTGPRTDWVATTTAASGFATTVAKPTSSGRNSSLISEAIILLSQ